MKATQLLLIALAFILNDLPAYANPLQVDSQNEVSLCKKGVSYIHSGGRFGDQLIGYLHAKWISYKYKIPLLYKPFAFSDQLVVHHLEKRFNQESTVYYDQVIYPHPNALIDYDEPISALYVIPYFPECVQERCSGVYYAFQVDWNDPGFRKEIKRCIKPLYFRTSLQLPKDYITVAVHVRTGGGYDGTNVGEVFPLKVPPHSFYMEQIQRIYEIFNGSPLYAYIFTDDKDPAAIAHYYKNFLNNADIEFGYRQEANSHDANVLEDFFEMTKFDCLIRPESNYSICASKIADYKVMITPSHSVLIGNTIYIDETIEIISK